MKHKSSWPFILISILIVVTVAACQANSNLNMTSEPVSPTATAMPPTATATAVPIVEATAETSSPLATVVVTVIVTSTPLPTEVPAEATPEPTATPLPPEPTPTPSPEPASTPSPVVIGPAWLKMFNQVRDIAHLPHVSDSAALTVGSQWHSRYMVVNDDPIAHKEDINNALYDDAGNLAAKNGNIFATSQTEANYQWGINFWMSAPFHLIAMIHPGLETAGYGDYVEAVGDINMAAVMDVRSERDGDRAGIQYPIFFPANGSATWVVRHSLYEWPDAVGSCPGYARPTGAPIMVQFGDGSTTPNVSSYALSMGDKPLDVCMFSETSYRNSDAYAQQLGRTILGEQDAVVLLPRQPLAADAEYTVQIVANGETYTWQFRTIKRPPAE